MVSRGGRGNGTQPYFLPTLGCQASLGSSLWGERWRYHGETDVGAGSSSVLKSSSPTFDLFPPEERGK